MSIEQYLLQCLGEEGAELSQAASKAIRFGLDDVWPGKPTTNRSDLKQEINDLLGVIELLMEHGYIREILPDRKLIEAKKEKVLKMMDYSRSRGRL